MAPRLVTQVPGLDTVLQGGLVPGAVYIVQGTPGSGKTILANQICFAHAATGGRSVYVTLLSESHDRMIRQLAQLQFYDSRRVPDSVYYESVFGALATSGLEALLRLLATEIQGRDASLLIVDGLFVVADLAGGDRAFRRFIHELCMLAHLTDTTMLLLTNSQRPPSSPEYTMVDGWIELGYTQAQYRIGRFLQVHKSRGSDLISGQHLLTIGSAGVAVLPRLESVPSREWPPRGPERLSTGVPELDRMLSNGLESGSSTLIAGPTGVGKTTFGLHFLDRCSPREPGLLFGFYEDERDLRRKSERIGLAIGDRIDDGSLAVLWQPPVETMLDEIGYALLRAVREREVRRVVVDGVEAFQQAALYPERLGRFLTALATQLRVTQATTLFTLELQQFIRGDLQVQFGPVSAVAENIVMLRYVELAARICRTLTVLKARSSAFESSVREFDVTEHGIRIGDVLRHVDDVLTGHGHLRE